MSSFAPTPRRRQEINTPQKTRTFIPIHGFESNLLGRVEELGPTSRQEEKSPSALTLVHDYNREKFTEATDLGRVQVQVSGIGR